MKMVAAFSFSLDGGKDGLTMMIEPYWQMRLRGSEKFAKKIGMSSYFVKMLLAHLCLECANEMSVVFF